MDFGADQDLNSNPKRVWFGMSLTNVETIGFKKTAEHSHLRVGTVDFDKCQEIQTLIDFRHPNVQVRRPKMEQDLSSWICSAKWFQ